MWERYLTLSQIANLKEPKLSEVKQKVFDALKKSDVERNDKGEVAVHGVTYVGWASKV